MRSLSGPDNSPEAREGRRRGLQEHYDAVAPPESVEAALRLERELRMANHKFHDPVTAECRRELRLILGGAAIDTHDPIIDNLPTAKIYEFPTHPPFKPEPPRRAA